jgi:uncharacterized FAD-dependent dehydrogenase
MEEKIVEISIRPELRDDHLAIRTTALKKVGLKDREELDVKVIRRSIDARKKNPRYICKVSIGTSTDNTTSTRRRYPDVTSGKAVHIIGAGPAGYFAALELIKNGFKPIVFERGKDVQERRRDLRAIQQDGLVDPNSNYCFGEGGSGTYSDGKLYTRATKRGDVGEVLRILVDHGANPEILVEAHPHIGSNKLPQIVAAIRESILASGGEVRFGSRLTDLHVEGDRIAQIVINEDEEIPVNDVILATGHSARDIINLLHEKSMLLEFKPFALGVRVEHPQPLIDDIQYGQPRGEWLPAATYQLACQAQNRGVFSFCMCPGGLIVPAATAPGEIVVNGMSLSRRDSPFANSGMVVSVNAEDTEAFDDYGPLAGLALQADVEQSCFDAGDGSQRAPAQRLTDFMRDTLSSNLPETSYIPGIFPFPLKEILPEFVYTALLDGFTAFSKKMPGYITSEAVVVATESRTSSPVRIPRDDGTKMHPEILGLYPCGEGAGYAGGIVSAALDGQNVALAVCARVAGH